MKKNELIKLVNEGKMFNLHLEDFLLDETGNRIKVKLVKEGLNIDEYRHYEIHTHVYECEDGYMGIRGVSKVYGESSYSDIKEKTKAFEMVEVESISYEKVK